jgi:hypothetical protein
MGVIVGVGVRVSPLVELGNIVFVGVLVLVPVAA